MPSSDTRHPTPANRILSGVQPTGNLHLGNYLGAIRNWVALQEGYECFFMLADLHAITVPQDPAKLRANVRETASAYIACGINPDTSAIFHQSAVSAHAELAWILSCHTPLGWLSRMTQFKEKTQSSKLDMEALGGKLDKASDSTSKLLKNISKQIDLIEADVEIEAIELSKFLKIVLKNNAINLELFQEADGVIEDYLSKFQKAKLGLYSYPVLMAADILAYKATHVPVGHDQKQHLELCRDIAGAFNRAYNKNYNVKDNKGGFFPLPEPVIMGEGTRVMSLKDGSKKMSKSDESDLSRINLTDDADAIAKKFKKATSDSFPTIGESNETRPEAANLVNIYAALKGITRDAALAEVGDKQFSAFKQALTEVAVEKLSPITQKMRELMAAPDYIDQVLAKGIARAQEVAGGTMKEVKDLVGFLTL